VRFDEYSDIVIGPGPEEHTKLTCHSWHGKKGLYSQVHVREGLQDNGYWAIRTERNGLYKFELRRWPIELQIPICEGVPAVTGIPFVDDVPAGVPLAITGARIQIGDYKQNTNIDTNDHSAVFYCNLQSGSNRLQTWFSDESEHEMGAYYVYGSLVD
ncbi:MAG: N-acetylgalactosamine-4-sulfatase, partial [Chloroflexota bacterium]|nr:N-acetylgalactosamine-4-sulfatase [Chloroflexota bacterium]